MYTNNDRKRFPPLSKVPHMIHGGDYNPDQWLPIDPDVLPKDCKVFKAVGINSASVCIFGWAAIEPEEGVYTFEWLDKTIDTLYENGIYTILATPTGARPAWLDAKYPEVMRVNETGHRRTHGNRHNHCYTSPVYREYTKRIITKMAERYKNHPGIMMWHLNNEYGGPHDCYCDHCKAAFRTYLKEKYKGNIEDLNTAWWSRFWSHSFTDFEQIDPPSYMGEDSTHGLNLDWRRFCTHQVNEYMCLEYDTAKAITPDIPITNNFMDLFQRLDYSVMRHKLDLLSWDNYPEMGSDRRTRAQVMAQAAFNHDYMRTLKKMPFLVMESTPSNVNWKSINTLKRPGEHLLVSLHGVAHGADSVQYFQLRKGRGSSEMLHGAVIDHILPENMHKTRVFGDVKSVGDALANMDEIVGTCTPSEVAILYDIDNRNMVEVMQGCNNANKKHMDTILKHYGIFNAESVNIDVLPVEDDFSSYKLIIAPMLYMTKEATVKKIEEYVRNGGNIVFTYLSGYVNDTGLHYLGGLPANELKDVFGIWNEECDALYPSVKVGIKYEDNSLGLSGEIKAHELAELIHDEGAEVIARYSTEFYAGLPAITRNSYGKGNAYYIAARLDEEDLRTVYKAIIKASDVKRVFDAELPDGVEATMRADEKNEFVFVMNMSHEDKNVDLGGEYTDIITGKAMEKEIVLKDAGMVAFKRMHNA